MFTIKHKSVIIMNGGGQIWKTGFVINVCMEFQRKANSVRFVEIA